MDHILTGKAVSRAVRAHILLDAVLNELLLSGALAGTKDSATEEPQVGDEEAIGELTDGDNIHPDIKHAQLLYEKLMEGTRSAEEALTDPIFDKISSH